MEKEQEDGVMGLWAVMRSVLDDVPSTDAKNSSITAATQRTKDETARIWGELR